VFWKKVRMVAHLERKTSARSGYMSRAVILETHRRPISTKPVEQMTA
jgi:hypothetical protein